VPAGEQAGVIVKDAPVAAIRGVPGRLALARRLADLAIVNGNMAVAVNGETEGEAIAETSPSILPLATEAMREAFSAE
jgi:hypothetical protein